VTVFAIDADMQACNSAYGDLSNGCTSPGSHFNPLNQDHGAPSDTYRHVGDLGNIEADSEGVAKFEFVDKLISLNGPLSIVGCVLFPYI
jgi:Cu-Zn family superoxide dismutase